MKRLSHWLVNGVTVLSFLLCVGTCVLWVQSYRHCFGADWEAGDFPYDSRPIWDHYRSVGVNRGMLAAQSLYRRWPGGGIWSGPAPTNQPLRYFERAAMSNDWPNAIGYRSAFGTRSVRLTGFEVSWPLKSKIDAASNAPDGYLVLTYDVVVPLWSPALLFALFPAFWLGRQLRRNRPPLGHCADCCYDLTANFSGVCPECGTSVVS